MNKPLVEHGIWQCSGCRHVHRGRWVDTCAACGRTDYLTGSVSPLDAWEAGRKEGRRVRRKGPVDA